MQADSVDGNLAALRQYERETEHQEQALESVLENVKPLLDQLESIVSEIHEYDTYYENYDFSEVLAEEIQNAVEA